MTPSGYYWGTPPLAIYLRPVDSAGDQKKESEARRVNDAFAPSAKDERAKMTSGASRIPQEPKWLWREQ